jgi:hypothetical protein
VRWGYPVDHQAKEILRLDFLFQRYYIGDLFAVMIRACEKNYKIVKNMLAALYLP